MRERGREVSSIHWFSSSAAHNTWGWTRKKPGARNSVFVSHTDGRAQTAGPSFSALQALKQEAKSEAHTRLLPRHSHRDMGIPGG